MNIDTLYQKPVAESDPFEFNAAVAAVFPDMIRRSVPGYDTTLDAIGRLARRYIQPATQGYDLGCSLGAATLAMRHGLSVAGATLVAVDNSEAMLARCREVVAADMATAPVDLRLADICTTPIENASMVVLNYTLQFVPPQRRDDLLRRIAGGMRPGGLLLVSEKVRFDDPAVDRALVTLHEDFKRANAYTQLEITAKRAALEQVLIPDTPEHLLQRLRRAGFASAGVWLQQYNFVSVLAFT